LGGFYRYYKEMKGIFTSALLFICSLTLLSAQDEQPLPEGFSGLILGMTMDEAKEALVKESYFDYRGDPDVSLLPSPDSSIIECDGRFFIDQASFQFYDDSLFIIILQLDQKEIDFFSMFTALTEKYGEADYLDPGQVIWNDEKVQLSLERPLTVKYMNWELFGEIRKQAVIEDSIKQETRKDFIELF